MDGIFNSETSSFLPETDLLGIGQMEKDNFGLGGDRLAGGMALELPEETTPYYIEEGGASLLLNGQNEAAENGHLLLGGSGYLDIDSGGNLLTGQTEEMSLVEGEDLLTGGGLAIEKMVAQAVPIVRELLQGFAEKPEFEVEMRLAFGNSYDEEKADVLKAALSGEDLEVLRGIEIVDRDLINGAKGAFAGETEKIYLARDFVSENLGNVGAIAPVIVEEFGHYIDFEINSIDTPGDEGEIFVDLVWGVELSADELLAKQREDDWAIGFLNGERVGIEQAVISETLNFLGNNVRLGQTLPFNGEFRMNNLLNIINVKEQNTWKDPNFRFDWALNAFAEIVPFANLFSLGDASFKYPISLNLQLPNNVPKGETFEVKVNDLDTGDTSISGQGLEFASAGIDMEYSLGPIKLTNVFIKKPSPLNNQNPDSNTPERFDAQLQEDIEDIKNKNNSEIIFLGDLINYDGFPKKTDNLGKISAGDNYSLNFDLVQDLLALNVTLPKIGDFTQNKKIQPNPGPNLPLIQAKGLTQDSFIKLSGDIDAAILKLIEKTPQGLALNKALQGAGSFLGLKTAGLQVYKEENIYDGRGKVKIEADLFDIKANLGLGLQQDLEFFPKDFSLTMSLNGGQEQKKSLIELFLDEPFNFTAPSEGCGVMELKAKYELIGEINTQISPTLQISGNGQGMVVGGKVAIGPLEKNTPLVGPLIPPFKIPKAEDGSLTIPKPIISSYNNSDPFIKIAPIQIDKVGDSVRNIVEITYKIPYNMPISIEDTSIAEGNTGSRDMIFKVTRREISNEPLTLQYNSSKGNGSITIEAGQSTADIKIPIPGDEAVEGDERFTVTVTDPTGKLFAECKGGADSISATGTIIDDDEEPDPPEPPLPNPREFNDPRYITIDGKSLEFQAAGEFTLLESLNDDFKIQVRQEPVNNNPLNNAANATAIATILGGKRVGIYKDGQQIVIDGTPVNIADNEWIPVGDGRIYREGKVYSLVYPKGDQLIATMTEDRVNVSLFFSPERRDTVRGIFGTFNDNPDDDILKRDGTILTEPIALEQLYGEYADSWRVAPNESLFDYKPGEDTNTFTISNYPRKKVQLSDLSPADVEKANQLIGERINEIDPTLREGAIIDFILTGFDETVIEEAIAAGSVSAGSVVILDELGARDDFAFTNANLPIKLDVLSNDTVHPNTPIAIASFDQISTGGGNITQDNNGTPDDPSDDQLFYAPPVNFTGTDRFKYTIFDGTQPSTAIVSINIPNLNLATLQNNQGVTIKSTTPGNFTGVAVNQIGDINGDNIDDIATGAFAADPEGNNAAGETYVIFGTNQPVPNNIDPNTLNGSNGFSLEGFVQTGFSGGAVASAGDVNKDGINDMIIGAFGVTTNGQNNVGQAYVIFGSRDLFPPTIDIASLDGTNGFALTGLYEFDYAGSAVGSAGDFNRDGIDDVFVSAPGPLNGQAGRTYVLFGNSSGFPPSQNLSQLNGTNGVIIDGLYTKSGGSVSSAGDVNQDGYSDLIIGADIGGTESYVVYGGESLPATTYLSNLTNGFKIFGVDVVTDNGTNVSGVGDVNNDGIDDVIVGVTGTTADGVSGVSKGYVIFGQAGGLPSDVDVKTLNGANGFVITSANIDGISGMAVSGKGDFNQDGIADIILGKPNDNGNTGNSYVIFGSKESFPTNIDLASLNGTNGIAILGTETDDLTGVSVASAGDVNQDTVDDVIIGAPGNLFNDSPGKSYVVFGDGNFGNSVSLVFDEGYYLANNPEVNSAISSGLVRNGLEHFSQYGVDEERDFRVFLFNEKYYLEQNPDIANLVAQGVYSNGLEHFTKFGQFEGRKATPANETTAQIKFDEQYYLTQNPEVKQLIEQAVVNSGFEHFLTYGQYEGRKAAA